MAHPQTDPGTDRGTNVRDEARTDPEDRVHHHAKSDEQSPGTSGIRTLCGLTLDGPRPNAADQACCPMCAHRMHEMGARCRVSR